MDGEGSKSEGVGFQREIAVTYPDLTGRFVTEFSLDWGGTQFRCHREVGDTRCGHYNQCDIVEQAGTSRSLCDIRLRQCTATR